MNNPEVRAGMESQDPILRNASEKKIERKRIAINAKKIEVVIEIKAGRILLNKPLFILFEKYLG